MPANIQDNQRKNIRQLRSYLRMTQKQFLDVFFSDEDGTAKLSVASLSNLESRGGAAMPELIEVISARLAISPEIFDMPSDRFIKELDELELSKESYGIETGEESSGNIAALVNRLTNYFADEMFAGNLHRGDKLESDRVMSQKFHVGRSAFREAMKVLDVMGLVEIRPGQGTYLSRRETDFFVIPLKWSLFLEGRQIEEILVLRTILECQAAYLAAKCEDEEKLSKLGELYIQLQQAYKRQDLTKFLDLDIEFHLTIASCSENRVIYAEIQTIRNLMKHVSSTGMSGEEQMKQILEEHRRVYGLILARDPEGARDAMYAHMNMAQERYNYM